MFSLFFFNDTPPTEIYTLSLHDALPIFEEQGLIIEYAQFNAAGQMTPHLASGKLDVGIGAAGAALFNAQARDIPIKDRKSTRLNSSHGYISYAVFCLKKKKNKQIKR